MRKDKDDGPLKFGKSANKGQVEDKFYLKQVMHVCAIFVAWFLHRTVQYFALSKWSNCCGPQWYDFRCIFVRIKYVKCCLKGNTIGCFATKGRITGSSSNLKTKIWMSDWKCWFRTTFVTENSASWIFLNESVPDKFKEIFGNENYEENEDNKP